MYKFDFDINELATIEIKPNKVCWNSKTCNPFSSSKFYDDAVLDYLLGDLIKQKAQEAVKKINKEVNCVEHKKIDAINADIKNVIFNDPYTIILWKDGKKTIVKCQPGDVYDKEKGLALALVKHFMFDSNYFNTIFKKWLPEDDE